ncbi:MAG TPA: NADPH-dependent FMN reductase [bacterium]|nr:NADPH-dependent FMN reductase [bacterium]
MRDVTSPPLRVLGIPGSLRRGSYNRGLLEAAQGVVPSGMSLEITDLTPIPLYNADVEAQGFPPSVAAFRVAIAAADALLIATPEYNYSVPGVLKNAIDWASRPPDTPLRRKPIALMGASAGAMGTVRAQLSLRQTLLNTESFVLLKPELYVATARERFDGDGRLIDEAVRERIRLLLAALAEWVDRIGPRS